MQVEVSAGAEDQARILDVLTLAFSSDPSLRAMYPETLQYWRHYREFAKLFGGKAFETGNAHHTSDYAGAALWLPPGTRPDEEALVSMLQRTIREQDRDTVFGYFDEMPKYYPREPHWHLAIIGVDPIRHGQGHGSALLEHGLAACDRHVRLAYLECTNPRNVGFYERHGFRLLGTIQKNEGPPLFPMIREPK